MLLREWYMHPNGQLPAYEFAFGDVNPPVHAWAAWRVYKIAVGADGQRDRAFLARVFHKLLLNFTWWVNRKDAAGRQPVFAAAFSASTTSASSTARSRCRTGDFLEQADGTAWMAFFCVDDAVDGARAGRERSGRTRTWPRSSSSTSSPSPTR